MANHSKGGGKAKPDEVKALQGTLRKDRVNTSKPTFTGVPECPAWLEARAAAEWERLAPQLEELGMLADVYLAMFAAYCQAFGDYVTMCIRVNNKDALTFTTEKGYVMRIPEVGMRQEAYRQMKEMATEFGFSPASRSRIILDIRSGAVDDPSATRKISLLK